MAETVGSLVDKLSIIELKVHYMEKQAQRTDASEEHVASCRRRVAVLKEQRHDLSLELNELLKDVLTGKKALKVYRQYKMYNDPVYRPATSGSSSGR